MPSAPERPKRADELERPTIVLAVNQRVPETAIRDVLLGIEEEGVPLRLERSDELNPLVLAHAASQASILGVGIGVSLDYIVVTTDRLPEGRPYLANLLQQSPHADRTYGANAARLVKRLPLRPVPVPQS